MDEYDNKSEDKMINIASIIIVIATVIIVLFISYLITTLC